MYSKFTIAEKYLLYYLTASNGKGHGIHSPFIFRFVQEVLNDRKEYYGYNEIEEMRDRMKVDDTVITVEDLGAGSGSTKKKNRRIRSTAFSFNFIGVSLFVGCLSLFTATKQAFCLAWSADWFVRLWLSREAG